MYTYLDKYLNEKPLPEGVRITDGPRKAWYNLPWPKTSVFLYVKEDGKPPYYATLTETAVKLGMTVRALSRMVANCKDPVNYRIHRVPKSIFVSETGRAGIATWEYFWKY